MCRANRQPRYLEPAFRIQRLASCLRRAVMFGAQAGRMGEDDDFTHTKVARDGKAPATKAT